MLKAVSLRGASPLVRGETRIVYSHPGDPGLLIKVLSPQFVARRRDQRRHYGFLKRARMNSVFVREIQEQLVLLGRGEDIDSFMPRIFGHCDTDLGLGQVVEAVCTPDGKLAPTLWALIETGRFDATARSDLEGFHRRLLESDIRLTGLGLRNVVYGADAGGKHRFMLIDDFGDSRPVSWKGISRSANRRHKQKLLERMNSEIERLRMERP